MSHIAGSRSPRRYLIGLVLLASIWGIALSGAGAAADGPATTASSATVTTGAR